jgi:Ca2+-binding EF-hand superfamily protein
MTNNQYPIRVHEVLHRKGDKITAAEYVYDEILGNAKTRQYRVIVKKEEFDGIAATIKKWTIPFESFTKVTRPLLMGNYATTADISEAFQLLDTDKSDTIDINELAIFMPAIIPGSNAYMLLRHFETVDTNKDYKLNLDEFTEFIKKNIVRDLALKRL